MWLAKSTAGLAATLFAFAGASHAQAPPLTPSQPPPAAVMADPAAIGESLFYAVPGESSANSFRAHADQIGVIAPQSFALDRHGTLKGSLPADIAGIARNHSVPVMPLVINADFSRTGAVLLLKSPLARDHAIGALLQEAQELSLDGWQLDFEGLPSTQRAAFSAFVAEAAGALHRHGKLLSVAVAARTGEDPTTYTWKTFSGVYDYAALGASADFLSVMAYPEGDSTHPGPLASYPWVDSVVRHVLEYVPADKISLGLPTYQSDWSQRRTRVSEVVKVGAKIKKTFHFVYNWVRHNGAVNYPDDEPLQWDPVLQSSYRTVGEGKSQKVSWIEDQRSFSAKLALVAIYHLRGFSVWRIGLEDQAIWNVLPQAPRAEDAATAASGAGH